MMIGRTGLVWRLRMDRFDLRNRICVGNVIVVVRECRLDNMDNINSLTLTLWISIPAITNPDLVLLFLPTL